eukprot:Gb_12382 [translate_table: standard]
MIFVVRRSAPPLNRAGSVINPSRQPLLLGQQAVQLQNCADCHGFPGLYLQHFHIEVFELGYYGMKLKRNVQCLGLFRQSLCRLVQHFLFLVNPRDFQMRRPSRATAESLQQSYPLDRLRCVQIDDVHHLFTFHGIHDRLVNDSKRKLEIRAEIKEDLSCRNKIGDGGKLRGV